MGLLAALVLRENGVDVAVIERKEPEHARNFAVVLHPGAVALLGGLGLTNPLVWQGQAFRRIAVYWKGSAEPRAAQRRASSRRRVTGRKTIGHRSKTRCAAGGRILSTTAAALEPALAPSCARGCGVKYRGVEVAQGAGAGRRRYRIEADS